MPYDYNSDKWFNVLNPHFDPTTLEQPLPSAGPGAAESDPADSSAPYQPLNPGDRSLWTEAQGSATFYTRYEIVTRVEGDTGIDGDPLAKPKGQGETAFYREHGGFAMLSVAWLAERLGDVPILPHPILEDELYVLKTYEIAPEAPVPNSDGKSLNWRVRGVYRYILQRPPDLDNFNFFFPVGVTPLHIIPASVIRLGPNNFSKEPLAFLSGSGVSEVTF